MPSMKKEGWRRRIGFEPTKDSPEPFTGFEDQGHHQTPPASAKEVSINFNAKGVVVNICLKMFVFAIAKFADFIGYYD